MSDYTTCRAYSPRAYAELAAAHFRADRRRALFAKPGMGKTTMVLTHLDIKHNLLGEDRPTLVLGPKRVAEHVWVEEARKWQHLRGLEVTTMCGTPAERLAALRNPNAQVKCINYENMAWLVEHAKPWPFGTVVADESTRLKSFRTRQGGQRARELAKVIHSQVDDVILLTGTPAPNGLKDLWGQMFFLDAGARLGRSFRSFEDRWFATIRRPGQQFGGEVIVLPGAADEIHARIADLCLTLDPADWFDMAAPIVNVVELDMPARALKKYREFERELFLELDGAGIEAVNAAVKSMKCLQLANGAAYTDDGKTWAELHQSKLEALESLVEENGGEPILVAYQWKSDLERLKKYFPDGLVLSDDKHMRAAKAGQGKVWFGHPASMGHGVDGLQEHCGTVCFFGHWWDLELHDQFIERVGPMRQLQSGKNRVVTIHYLVTRGTVDSVVLARMQGKGEVQNLLMQYMKEKK